MHRIIFLVMLLVAAPVFAQDQPTDLRTMAGRGSTKTQFDVKVDKKQHSVAQSESGKALVYVIEEYKSDPYFPSKKKIGAPNSYRSLLRSTFHNSGSNMFTEKTQGILILAPIVRRKNESAEQNETDEPSTAVYFRAAYVFDGLSWDFRESEFTRSVGKYRAEEDFFDA